LETREALECLAGDGPEDLAELSASLTGEMLFRGGVVPTPEAGTARSREALAQGLAVGRMRKLVELQGGDPHVVEDPGRIPRAPEMAVLESPSGGFVEKISPTSLGYGVVELGGGRRKMGDQVDLRVGFVLQVGPGDRVSRGDPIGEVHAADVAGLRAGLEILSRAVEISEVAPAAPRPAIIERVVASS
jgi:pyrimidine-nucleoside phosphorylase